MAWIISAKPTPQPPSTPAPTPETTLAPTPAPTLAPRPAAVCLSYQNGVIPVTVDPNGDIASLSEVPIGFNECSSRDWSNVPIVLSCGCDFRRKTNGTSNGYDQGATFWCTAGANYFHINILHPDCTDAPTLAPTPEPTPSVTPLQTPGLTPTTTTRAPSTAAPKPTPTAPTSHCGKVTNNMSTTLAMISLKPTVPTTTTVVTTAPIHLDVLCTSGHRGMAALAFSSPKWESQRRMMAPEVPK
ncbi:unnamed protein product [Aphanomyces euteiches]